jgi:antitoxin ParD1/3/4
MLGEQEELEAPDLREELLRRGIQAAIDDPRPGVPAEEVETHFEKLMEEPRREPAVWRKEG